MIGWRTRPQRQDVEVEQGASPALVYHKWHAYDPLSKKEPQGSDRSFSTTTSRVEFLADVASRVNKLIRDRSYRTWYENYRGTLTDLGAKSMGPFSTVWRLVAGLATNPALETGIHLHPLYGFPYLPGSAVKGLLHHQAEMEIVAREEWQVALEDGSLPNSADKLTAFLDQCEQVWELFGSLTLEQGKVKVNGREEPIGPETPRTWLSRWRKAGDLSDSAGEERELPLKRASRFLDQTTGGRAVFYDAAPVPGGSGPVLEVDVLNPHYPEYYRESGKHPPSDDQNPIPVFFLAVAPEVPFAFHARLRRGEPDDLDAVEGYLRRALNERGIGGKTAAGYGYFNVDRDSAEKGAEPTPPSSAASLPETEIWPQARVSWDAGRRQLKAVWEGKEALGGEEERERLPESLLARLTGKKGKKKKGVAATVTVRVEGAKYFRIESVKVGSDESD